MDKVTKIVRIPITNCVIMGDYTAQILVGSANSPANVILDTGSSTLAIKETAYKPQNDQNLTPTHYAQDITYGTGGWAGPIVQTSVTMGVKGKSVALKQTPLAVIADEQQGNFGRADGILGLGYNSLNNAYNLSDFLEQHNIDPPVTYPWPFQVQNTQSGIRQFQDSLRRIQPQEDNITPYFTELEEKGIAANKFAFYTLRSNVHVTSGRETVGEALNDPLNQGFFILGGGEEETDLYEGSFKTLPVLHDAYYNTNLKYAQVEGGERVQALALQPHYEPYAFTNSIIDSGTNSLALAAHLFQGLLESLGNVNSRFAQIINEYNQLLKENKGYPVDKLGLQKWPNINFVFKGEDGKDVTLSCSPQTYWQVNAPAPGQALFKISGMPQGSINQSILGLPLMNNYYTIFDRSVDRTGVIKFAAIKAAT